MTETALAGRKSIINAVANEVRAELARHRISHQEAARRLGWKPAYIGRRMTGDTPLDAADLQQLADLLEVPVTRFFPRDWSQITEIVCRSLCLPGITQGSLTCKTDPCGWALAA